MAALSRAYQAYTADKQFCAIGSVKGNIGHLDAAAGMAGLLSAIKLREMGIDNFTVYEKAANLGGTWRENTYPGLSCDIPSRWYCFSFALRAS